MFQNSGEFIVQVRLIDFDQLCEPMIYSGSLEFASAQADPVACAQSPFDFRVTIAWANEL